MTRRRFMQGAVGAAAIGFAAAVRGQQPGATDKAVRLGAPVFVDAADPEALARAHRELRYGAAYCPEVKLEDGDRIRAIAEAFERQNVAIAEVGRWCNLLDADSAKRKANLDNVINGLALAEAVGARCCVNIAGSFNPDVWYGPHPENLSQAFFDAAVENARAVIDAVKPKRAKFAYEMMGWSLPDSVDAYLKLMAAVDREGFAVHLDPCNLVNCPERFYSNAALLNDCFDRLGPHIVSCHAKDLAWEVEMNVHFREVRPGAGAMDYAVYLRRLAELPQQPPLMLEHLDNAEHYDEARRHLLALGAELGVAFV